MAEYKKDILKGIKLAAADASAPDTDRFFAGRLLVAMPNMGDPRFEKSVVFLCAHDETGAMGLVVNKIVPDLTLATLLEELTIAQSGDIADKTPVFVGGPVETARGFLLHSAEFTDRDSIRVKGDYAVTGTIDALRHAMGENGPRDRLFALGYAGWGAGQLEDEIRANAWLVCDATPDLVFGGDQDTKWARAMLGLGIDPALFTGAAGRA